MSLLDNTLTPRYLLAGAVAIIAVVAVVAAAGLFLLSPTANTFSSTTVLTIISGEAGVQQTGQLQYAPARDGMTLQAGDHVRTTGSGFAMITFFDGSTATLEPASELAISSMVHGRPGQGGASAIALQQVIGVVWTRAAPMATAASRFQIDTPAAVILVQGTLLLTEVGAEGVTTVRCYEGLVTVRALSQETELTANTRVTVTPGQPPQPATLQPPANQRIVVHSSPAVWARVVETGGRSAGFAAPGIQVNQLPESLVGSTAGPDRRFDVPVTTSGEWDVIVEGAAEGDYQVVVQGVSEGNLVFTKAYRGAIRPGQRFSTKMNLSVQNGRLIGGQVGEFSIALKDAPYGKFVIMQAAVDGIPGTATAVAIKGTPTAAVARTATVTPTATAATTDTSTPEPSPEPPAPTSTAAPRLPTPPPASPTRPAATPRATPLPTATVPAPPPTGTVAAPPPTATVAAPPPTATVAAPPPTATVAAPPPTATVAAPPPTATVPAPMPTATPTALVAP